MISFLCPGCRRTLSVKDEFAGKAGTCPQCKRRLNVPAPAAPRPVESATEAAPPAPAAGGEPLDFLAPPQGLGELGRLGSYRVLKVLGTGGMGMVLLAEDPALKRSVALKVMRPELAARPDAGRRFLREAQATAAIEHPNIVHVYQVGEDRGVPFLAMPFLKGEALDARLKREKRLPVAEAVYLGRQIAEGLAAAHRNGLIHRDIKPANIWLERQEGEAAPRAWVKILDFGLARAVADDDGHLTKTGAILGTPAFMAPEQARGGKVDHRCDLFSLGAVLYRMLTGEAPFKGSDPISLIAALALDTPRPVRELNPETPAPLADLVMRLLAKDPDGRPPTARAVADALAAMEQDQTQVLETGARATPAAKPGRKGRRWLLSVVGGGGLLGLLALVLVFILHPGSRPADPGPPPQPPKPEKVITNSIGMKLVRIEPGKFVMGSPPDEVGRRDDEDAHEVAITKPFYLGACKVTVGQFKAFVKETKYQTDAEKTGEGAYVSGPKGALTLDPKVTWRTPPFVQNDDEPVVCVTWDDALAFCVWLGKKEGKPYSLPTEAQWEYACRAGSQTRSPFGEDGDATQYVSFDANSQGKTHAVGQKKPNAWGLYDMEGITFELTADWYDKDYYKISPTQDPPGPGAPGPVVQHGVEWAGGAFAARGLGLFSPGVNCRAANRIPSAVLNRNTSLGFRVALVPEQMTTNSIGMKLKWIPAGKFLMGSPADEPDHKPDEGPRHEVDISRPIYVGTYPVTVGAFRAFVKATGYKTDAEKDGKGGQGYVGATWKQDPAINWQNPGNPAWKLTDDQPVVCVTWNDAVAFCSWLSNKEGRSYRLPTEAEWEYACRAGTRTVYSFGDDAKCVGDYAWVPENSDGRVHAVGGKKPNAWGLYDMHGNVFEWCADWYGKDAYRSNDKQDPQGPGSGTQRILRGASWDFKPGPAACRAARRGKYAPGDCNVTIGFRVVLLP